MGESLQCACGKRYKLPEGSAGKKFKCKACGHAMTVPAPSEPDQDEYDLAGGDEPARPAAAVSRLPSQVPMRDKSLRGAFNTYASNPGKLQTSLVQYLKTHPKLLILSGAAALSFVIASVFLGPVELFGALIFLAMPISLYQKERKKFHMGDVCGGVVVSDSPYRVAVYTDLATGRAGARPAILIIEQSLSQMHGGAPQIGTRVATVATYVGQPGSDAWGGFMPVVVNCASTNDEQIRGALASIDPGHFQFIEQFVQTVPVDRSGLYRLWLPPDQQFEPIGNTGQLIGLAAVVFGVAFLIWRLATILDHPVTSRR
jgi:hypothetical protein